MQRDRVLISSMCLREGPLSIRNAWCPYLYTCKLVILSGLRLHGKFFCPEFLRLWWLNSKLGTPCQGGEDMIDTFLPVKMSVARYRVLLHIHSLTP